MFAAKTHYISCKQCICSFLFYKTMFYLVWKSLKFSKKYRFFFFFLRKCYVILRKGYPKVASVSTLTDT